MPTHHLISLAVIATILFAFGIVRFIFGDITNAFVPDETFSIITYSISVFLVGAAVVAGTINRYWTELFDTRIVEIVLPIIAGAILSMTLADTILRYTALYVHYNGQPFPVTKVRVIASEFRGKNGCGEDVTVDDFSQQRTYSFCWPSSIDKPSIKQKFKGKYACLAGKHLPIGMLIESVSNCEHQLKEPGLIIPLRN